MIQRILLYPVVLVLLLTALYLSDHWYKDTSLLSDYALELSVFIGEQASDALAWASSHADAGAGSASTAMQEDMLRQANVPYTVLVYDGDSLVNWNNNHAIPLDKPKKSSSGSWMLQELPGGIYALKELSLQPEAWLLVPLRYQGAPGERLPLFAANPAIPSTVLVHTGENGEVVSVDGQPLCRLSTAGSIQPRWVQGMRAGFWGLFLVVFIMMLYRIADVVRLRFGFGASLAVLGIPILLLVTWSSWSGYMARSFPGIEWLSQQFSPAFLGVRSVGDLLQLVFMLLLGLGYALRRFPEQLPKSSKNLWAAFAIVAVAAGIFCSAVLWNQVRVTSGIAIDADSILRTNGPGLAVLLAGLLLQIAFVMLALVCWRYRMDDPLRAPSPVWLLVGLLVQALFNTWLLYAGYRSIENEQRSKYAAVLAEERDSIAEFELQEISNTIEEDGQIENLLKPWPFKPERQDMESYLSRIIYAKPYFFQHYKVRAHAFDAQRQALFQEQAEDWNAVVQQTWEPAQTAGSFEKLRYAFDKNEGFQYLLKFTKNRMGDPSQTAELLLSFQRVYPMPNRAYSRLFYQTPYKDLRELPGYDFAVHRKEHVQVEYGRVAPGIWQPLPPPGDVEQRQKGAFAVARSESGLTVSGVGRNGGSGPVWLYFFSILFSLSTLLVLIIVLANRFLLIAPEGGFVSLNTKGSLARRIHIGSIGLIGGAFVVISVMTYRHFTQAAFDNALGSVNTRSDAMVNSLRRAVGDRNTLRADSLNADLRRSLSDLAEGLNLDAQVYDQRGILLAGTRPELTQVGLLPSRMSPAAKNALQADNSPQFTVTERPAGRLVDQRYLPLRNLRNELLGFVGVPVDVGRRIVGQEVSDFIGLLATLFMSLLLVAFVATLAIARSIIKPLKLISERIKQLRLDNQNLPLEYTGSSQDELSDLIEEYNRMVDKLEDSKIRLIRLEREGAWREMARQVAHDIKNPLTTMKLSMQQLERVSSNPEQAAAYLKKAITRLIEQIDSLAQIASEFSMFANLDIQKKSDLVINEVVESVFDLFTEQPEAELKLDVPYERLHINGDKNHLIRVFNNLIINAIQAIPSDRAGKIAVSLFRRGDQAVVQIGDNGGGIPPEIRDRVFEPNFTTKTSGSGLGLAICRKIVEALDGTIRFETRDNEGTDFFVEFPITFEEPAEQTVAVG